MSFTIENKCIECGRVFDLLNDFDVIEFFYGHDCEVTK